MSRALSLLPGWPVRIDTLINGLLMLFIVAVLAGCETYKTRYGPTPTSIAGVGSNHATYRMDLSYQQLTELPIEFAELAELRVLNLSGNPIADLNAELAVVCGLPNLNTLVLNAMQLTELPASLRNCRQLTHLSLAANPELSYTSALEVLSGLRIQYLNLAHNELTTLPASIAELGHLRDLRLSHNRLADPDAYQHLGRVPQLYSLWLDNNELTALPDSVGALAQVRYLFLDHNHLTQLPAAATGMQRLIVIHLTHNRLRRIPPRIQLMSSLIVAFLGSNDISELGEASTIANLGLRGIVLDNNQLSSSQVAHATDQFRNYFLFSAANQRR